MKLYFSRNPNPRLAVAVARYLDANVEFEWASPLAPGQAEKFRPWNPNLSLPILVESGGALWETDAIACRLSRNMHSDLWRTGDAEPEMILWLSWGKENFVRACDIVHFERGTKQRHGLGAMDRQAQPRAGDRRHLTNRSDMVRDEPGVHAPVSIRPFDCLKTSRDDTPPVK